MDINDLIRLTNEFYSDNERSKESLEGYYKTMMKVRDMQKTVNRNKKAEKSLQAEIAKLSNDMATNASLNTQENRNTLRVKRELAKQLRQQINLTEQQLEAYKKTNKVLNLTFATISSTEKLVFGMGKLIVKNTGYFLDQMRAVRETEKAMGLLSSHSKSFRQTMYEASFNSNKLGVDTKELAKYQQEYSELLGRNVVLTKSSLENMAEMNSGTGMSVSNMTELLSLTDGMGLNVNRSIKDFEKFSNKASQSGINQVKAYSKLNSILKLTNKYNFKEGAESMRRMAIESETFKTNIEEISALSDKLFDVEGAIEMGAQLQVLGGKWAQIADPMELMFKARNDMEGLQKSVIEAASGAAQWDKANKTFSISSMEMHRMKEAAKMTGMSLETLRDMAIETAKASHIKSSIDFNASDDEMNLIKNMAQFNEDGTFSLNIDGKDVNSKDLYRYAGKISEMVKEQATFEERAKKAMLFDQKLTNTFNSFKSMALPIFEAFDKSVSPLIDAFNNWIGEGENIQKVQEFVQTLTDKITALGKFLVEEPHKAFEYAMYAVGAKVLFEGAKYFAMGVQLGNGFNAVANVNGGGGGIGGGLSNMFGGKNGGKFLGKNIGKAKILKGAGIASALGLVGDLGLDYAADNGMMDKKGLGYKLGKIASSAASWGGTGAMAGTVVPGLGNGVGAAIGAIGGGLYEAYNQFSGNDEGDPNTQNIAQDFIARPNQEPIKFSSADTLVGLKKDGGIGKALLGQTNSNSSNTVIDFAKPLEVKGEIVIKGANGTNLGNILSDPMVKREIARMVQEQLSLNLSGGKHTTMNLL